MTEVCRLCNSNLRQHGVLQHVHSLFKKTGNETLSSQLKKIGVEVKDTPSEPHLICQTCYRQIPRLQKAHESIQKWKVAVSDDQECQEAVQQQPKRCRDTLTPSKTPRKPKRTALPSSPQMGAPNPGTQSRVMIHTQNDNFQVSLYDFEIRSL